MHYKKKTAFSIVKTPWICICYKVRQQGEGLAVDFVHTVTSGDQYSQGNAWALNAVPMMGCHWATKVIACIIMTTSLKNAQNDFMT